MAFRSFSRALLTRWSLSAEEAVLALVDFPKQIVIALAVAVKYMKGQCIDRERHPTDHRNLAFGLENAFRHRASFTRFINRAHMLLSSNTLINLCVYHRASSMLTFPLQGDLSESDGWWAVWEFVMV